MEEVEKIIESFLTDMGAGKTYMQIDPELIEQYENVFMTDKDNSDVITSLWKKYGFQSFKDNRFWTINPERFSYLAKKFPNVSQDALAFARTGLGNLFIYEKLEIGDTISYLNVHSGQSTVASTSFEVFFEFDIVLDEYWKEDIRAKKEFFAKKKRTKLEHDQCLAYIPALVLGGNESTKNLKVVNIFEHLEMLSQLYN
jgi:hypothetical protein